MTTQSGSTQTGEWLSIREASLRLSISELTVRRRIKDGRLRSKLEGGKYFVLLGQDAEPVASVMDPPASNIRPSEPAAPVQAPQLPAVDLDRFLAEQARLAEQAGRATLLAEQLEALQTQYSTLQDGAMALANRNGWLESKLDEREREIKLLEDSRRRPSWWRRVFLGAE
jgi:hypothetical protein